MSRNDDSYNSGFVMGGVVGIFISAMLLIVPLASQHASNSKRIRELERQAVEKGYAIIMVENDYYKLVWKEEE